MANIEGTRGQTNMFSSYNAPHSNIDPRTIAVYRRDAKKVDATAAGATDGPAPPKNVGDGGRGLLHGQRGRDAQLPFLGGLVATPP